MASHASYEERSQQERHGPEELVAFNGAGGSGYVGKGRKNEREEEPAPIPDVTFKTENKSEEIDAKWHDPKQRHGGNVLREQIRDS